jgi:hypothetical protein
VDHGDVVKTKLRLPDDDQYPTLDVKQVAIKHAAVGTRVKIETKRFDAPQPELDAQGNEVELYSVGCSKFTYSTVTVVSNANHKDQLKVKYDDDDDELWSHYNHLKNAESMSDPDNMSSTSS